MRILRILGAVFDLVFKPCQIFSWIEFVRMDRLAPRLAFCLQDIIGVRCDYFNSPRRQIVLQRTAELSDRVFTISEFSRTDFCALLWSRYTNAGYPSRNKFWDDGR